MALSTTFKSTEFKSIWDDVLIKHNYEEDGLIYSKNCPYCSKRYIRTASRCLLRSVSTEDIISKQKISLLNVDIEHCEC